MLGGAFNDIIGQDIVGLTNGKAIQATNYIARSTHPTVTSFNLNMALQVLTLTFSKSVALSTFDPTALDRSSKHHGYREWTRCAAHWWHCYVCWQLTVCRCPWHWPTQDVIAMQLDDNMADSTQNSFISFTQGLVASLYGLNVVAISSSNALAITVFVADNVPLTLTSFSLSMELGLVSLTIAEPVRASSFAITAFTLQDPTSQTMSPKL